MVPQQCETTIPLNLLSKIVKMVNIMLCIFSTIEIIKKCQLTIKWTKQEHVEKWIQMAIKHMKVPIIKLSD